METDVTSTNSVAAAHNAATDVEHIKFKWTQEVPQYGHKLLRRLDEFRKKNMFYDVTLKASDCDLCAHKVVLAACGGMFRSHFVDAKTKKISSHVDEVSFPCPGSGIRSILKFAYSGVLEITHNNLLPTLQAAILTEMKEVQEICADISMSRLGWILLFDGTEESLNHIKSTNKYEIPQTLESAYVILHRWLEINESHFSRDPQDDDVDARLCYKEVKTRWPQLRHVYTSIIDCLQKAKQIEKPTQVKRNGESHQVENDDATNPNSKTDSSHAPSNNHESRDQDADVIDDVTTSSDVEMKETILSSADVPDDVMDDVPGDVPVVKMRNMSTNENVKPPVCKPRSVSTPGHNRNHSNGSKKSRPPSPPCEISTPQSSQKTIVKANIASPPSSASPTPPRRKPTAPKPPVGAAPSITKVTSSSPKLPSKKTTPGKPPSLKVKSGSPRMPPPRPKPPSVRKKTSDDRLEAMTSYDDALNPFSDDVMEIDKEHENGGTPNNEKDDVKKVDASRESDLNPFE